MASGLVTEVADPGGVIDYSDQIFAVGDQGQRGSCFSFAWTYLLMWLYKQMGLPLPVGGLSEAYFYSQCKKYDGSPNEDGSDNGTVAMVATAYGTCTATTLPYIALASLAPPSFPTTMAVEDQEAKQYRITNKTAYVLHPDDIDRSNALHLIRQALLQYGPFVIGIEVYSSFQPDAKGSIPIPGTIERDYYEGCHDILLVGDDPDLGIKFINSWGAGWGVNGYGYHAHGWESGYFSPTGNMADKAFFLTEGLTGIDLNEPTPKPSKLTSNRAKQIIITPDSNVMQVDGVSVALDQPAIVDNTTNRMLAPVHAVADHQGYSVVWDGQKATLTAI